MIDEKEAEPARPALPGAVDAVVAARKTPRAALVASVQTAVDAGGVAEVGVEGMVVVEGEVVERRRQASQNGLPSPNLLLPQPRHRVFFEPFFNLAELKGEACLAAERNGAGEQHGALAVMENQLLLVEIT